MTLGASETMNLSGTWRLQLDRENRGVAERWFARPLPNSADLPGSLPAQQIGDDVRIDTPWTGGIFDRSYFDAFQYAPYRQPGHIKVPFWLQPEKVFVGAAWYQREIQIPATWHNRRIVLTLERPHWKTSVWLDERAIGSNDSLSVPHEYDLGTDLQPGAHELTIRVDNTLNPDIGENSHSISDHTQGNWNGIVGRIELIATAPAWFDDLQVWPQAGDRTALVRGRVGHTAHTPSPQTVRVIGGEETVAIDVSNEGTFSGQVSFGAAAALWDEFSPTTHRITAVLDNGETREVTFGFRRIEAEGRQLRINARKLFLRGTLECAAFPRTGHPPMDVESWRREFTTIRAHGLNHVRFHSWCPPEAAFVAADELGVYLQIEVASWPNQSTTLGDGKPVDDWIEAETHRIIRAYGNHPSFIILCAGNEPGGEHYRAWLAKWVSQQKAGDARRLYTAGAGWPEIAENDFHSSSEPRVQHWGEGLKSRINSRPPETRTDYSDYIQERTVPVVSHEIGQWCAYPNLAEIPKYTGYLKPRNFDIFRDTLEAHGLGLRAHDFLIASGKLQALCYKEDIESALRTREMGGFQLLGLSDFPGQGTALVGVLDAFWESKGYITPKEFRRFCGPTVPLARFDRRVFTTAEHLVADVEVAHFGGTLLANAAATWKLLDDDDHAVASGTFPSREISIGAGNELGHVDVSLKKIPAPARYRFVVEIASPEVRGAAIENDWDVWVYPAAASVIAPASSDVLIANSFDSSVRNALEKGSSVWLQIPPERVRPDPNRGKISLGFSSIFWNTAWTHGQAPHTLGVFCDPAHPALAHFPTESHSNWQWWYVVTNAAAITADNLPANSSIVQVIDDWFTNRKLALVLEFRVGPGRLLVSSVNFSSAELDPVRRQLRKSLLDYISSPRFAPSVEATPDQIRQLFVE